MHEQINAIAKYVLEALIQWCCLHGIMSILYICKEQKRYLFIILDIQGILSFQINFHGLGPLKLIKTMLKSFRVLLGLSPVWTRYPKGSPKRSRMTCDQIEDIICK